MGQDLLREPIIIKIIPNNIAALLIRFLAHEVNLNIGIHYIQGVKNL